jgi:predicted transcriptional regulator
MAEMPKGGFEVFLDRLSTRGDSARQTKAAPPPDPADLIIRFLEAQGTSAIAEVLRASGAPTTEAIEALEQLEKYGLIEYETADRKKLRLSDEGHSFAQAGSS